MYEVLKCGPQLLSVYPLPASKLVPRGVLRAKEGRVPLYEWEVLVEIRPFGRIDLRTYLEVG